jgi:hypothetical protein
MVGMSQIPRDQIGRLRDATPNVMALRLQEQEVCGYFSVIFAPKAISSMTKQDMTGFLSYKQNKRWREISKEDVTADMDRLRAAVDCLVDETRPIDVRLNLLEPGRGELAVPHLGKAKLTPLLLVTHPKQYGVWNDYSERALTGMGLMPDVAGRHLGDAYAEINEVLVHLAAEYSVTLWWLDILLERIARVVR